jgi:thioredoxin-like negative regulator of GroEL
MIEIINNDLSVCDGEECYLLFYFTAKWCGPCQRIKPLLQKISEGSDPLKLKVYMIDIDENDEIAKEFQIRSVPTFYLYKMKELIGQTGGGDIKKVQELLRSMK